MKAASQFLLAIMLIIIVLVAVGRFDEKHNSNHPADMPADAHFIQTGYDLADNTRQGEWVACRLDAAQSADFCRVTNTVGTVVYQGDFLPVSSASAVPEDALSIGPIDPERMWVKGPAEQQMVPVITLANGERLVPAADRDALLTRWSGASDQQAADLSEPAR